MSNTYNPSTKKAEMEIELGLHCAMRPRLKDKYILEYIGPVKGYGKCPVETL